MGSKNINILYYPTPDPAHQFIQLFYEIDPQPVLNIAGEST